jgi:hypothetical protein
VETARALECDEDKEKFEAALRKIAASKAYGSARVVKKKFASNEKRVRPET